MFSLWQGNRISTIPTNVTDISYETASTADSRAAKQINSILYLLRIYSFSFFHAEFIACYLHKAQ